MRVTMADADVEGVSDPAAANTTGLVESGRLAVAGELCAGAIHEINNPLFAILTLTGFLLRDAEPGTKAHERLELVAESAQEIQQIVEGLHRFVRERSEWGLVALDEVARDAAALVRNTSAAKNVELQERYAGETFVMGDAVQLKQVFVNLLVNALQATAEGLVTVEVGQAEGDAVATVTDQGPGIPSEEAERAFDLFYTSKNGGGTGLGLAVSRAIAEAHGGTLAVAPSAEPGARLMLRLPVAAA